jgi:beta-lactamase regulating signal transducer with metallopeptidase domain
MFLWIVHNTLFAAALAGALLLLCRLRRCSPALLHAFWLLVLLRLAAPPGLVDWPWQLPTDWFEPTQASAIASVSPISKLPGEEYFLAEVPTVASTNEPIVATSVEPVRRPETAAAAADASLSVWLLRGALLIWIIGGFMSAIRSIVAHVRLYRVARAGVPASPRLQRYLNELATTMRIRPPTVKVVPGLASPLVGGFWRPMLLWPAGLDERLPEAGTRAVLVHELAHLCRRDHWVRLVETIAGCIWWWNPVYRVVRSRIRRYAEEACDAWVLSVLPQARRAYAEALVEVCSRVAKVQPLPALGVDGDDRSNFEKRLTMIMREKVACRLPRRTMLAIVLLALIAIPGLSHSQPESPPPASVKTDTEQDDVTIEMLVLGELVEIEESDDGRDQKLAALEEKIQAMIKELQALRRERAAKPAAQDSVDWKKHWVYRDPAGAASTLQNLVLANANLRSATALRELARMGQKMETVMMSRATYTLPAAKAEALAKFMKENVKSTPLTIAVDGGSLTVTTTPEMQRVIESFVSLMQESGQKIGPKPLHKGPMEK